MDELDTMVRTNLPYWFSKIRDAGVPVPKTVICDSHLDSGIYKEGEDRPGLSELVEAICEAGRSLGVLPPYFLRTGHTSAKHNWSSTCFLPSLDPVVVRNHVLSLCDYSETCGILGLPASVWVVREFLPATPLFRCVNYENFPVVREFRLFARDGVVLYGNPYWPEGAVRDGVPDVADWKERLAKASVLTPAETAVLIDLASKASTAVGGCWSVDILDTNRGWFVTDMAVAERSYGWDHGISDPTLSRLQNPS